MKRWIINGTGTAAWNWDNPEERISLKDPDWFIASRLEDGDVILSDDRYKEGATYDF